jgi:hypothetical protein
MGIDLNTVRFLSWARSRGVDYRQTAMLGRQQFMGATVAGLEAALPQAPEALSTARRVLSEAGGYAEPLFRVLDATVVHSYDASDYEGASHLWDLNEPAPSAAREGYSVVFDGGTLEHVFDFPRALHGALTLIQPGGHYVSVTPAHGWFGHGFYQFSAELFQQLFQPNNGCELVALLMFEDKDAAPFYEVLSPEGGGGRHKYASLRPASLAVIARRTGPLPDRLSLQQSDYAVAWQAADSRLATAVPDANSQSGPTWSARAAAGFRRWAKSRFLALGGSPFFDSRMYRKIEI